MKNFGRVVLTLVLGLAIGLSAQQKKEVSKPVKATVTGHSVTLTWTNSTSAGVTGYNIYRGTTAGGEDFTTPINGATVVQSGYVDTNVTALTTYFYKAKAACPTCSPALSVASNEVSGTVPADPQPLPPTMNTPTAQ